MANHLITTTALAEKLGLSDRQTRNLLKTITPVRKLGTTYEITDADMKRLLSRKTQPGPKAKKGKKS